MKENPPKKAKPRKRYGSFTWTDPKTGYLYARVRLRNVNGTTKTEYRRALNVTHAKQIAEEIKKEFAERGQAFIDGRKMTVQQLADWYKEKYVIPAVYVDGAKVAGLRSWKNEREKIDRVCKKLGHHLIAAVDEEILHDYKVGELRSGKKKISTVNRELESVRAMFRKAVKKKWRTETLDFEDIIDPSLENRRTVTITDEDETVILKHAHDFITDSPRLYALIIALRDSGARPNELYPVNDYSEDKSKYEPIRWRGIFNNDGSIKDLTTFVSFKGKKREERIGIITERMKVAFLELWEFLKKSKNVTPPNAADLDNLVFPHTTFQGAWAVVRDKAGLKGLRLRDLRRDWVTRLARENYSDKLAQRGAGHKTMQMSFEYTEFDLAAAMLAKQKIDEANDRAAGIIDAGEAG